MKKVILIVVCVVMMLVIYGCTKSKTENETNNNISNDNISNDNIAQGHIIPDEIETIPEEYYSPAKKQGELVELYYDTYESKTYEQKTKELRKRAI